MGLFWGDFLSVIQLAAGLNTAYFSLTELRQPVFGSESRALANLRLRLDERETKSVRDLRAAHLQLVVDFDALQLRGARMDRHLGRACLAVASVYIALLVVASFWSHDPIGTSVAVGISIVGFIPISLCVGANALVMRQIGHKISSTRWVLERQLLEVPKLAIIKTNQSDD